MTSKVFIDDEENIAAQRMCEGMSVKYATTFLQKFVGLMFRKNFEGVMVFIFKKPSLIMVHTFFMRFPIDVIFMDKNCNAKKIMIGMKPWRVTYGKGVKSIVEQSSNQ